MHVHSSALVLLVACLLAGCVHSFDTTVQPSPPPRPEYSRMHAGVGRAEITPPPSAGLFGYGPEGKVPQGFRQRLFARALVLEDASGERIALVVADLGAVSELLHHEVAERLGAIGIGPDRLVLSATHTHSGPGNYFGRIYDSFGTTHAAAGHDPALVEFLAERIADAAQRANAGMREARVAWAQQPVWGASRNRALQAYQGNRPPWLSRFRAPATLAANEAAVDPIWTMLRVDTLGSGGRFAPAGAYSVFGIHGTAMPAANDLYDADVHGVVQRRLEQHIDSLNGIVAGARTRSVHLMANGSAGDVSPNVDIATRCTPPKPKNFLFGWFALALSDHDWAWSTDRAAVAQCVDLAVREQQRLGRRLGDEAIRIFDSLTPAIASAADARVRRSFTSYGLTGKDATLAGLCAEPRAGVATPGGVADGYTRLYGRAGIREGITAFGGRDCQRPKAPFLWEMQSLVADLPKRAQVSVFRIGTMTLATLPTEITVTAAGRIKDALGGWAARNRMSADSVALVSLTNGYMQYTTTTEEYMRQGYEGSSTLYGPNQARALLDAVTQTAARMRPDSASPPPITSADRALVRDAKRRLPPADAGPPHVARALLSAQCDGGVLRVDWLDRRAGRMLRDTTSWVRVDEAGRAVAWDGHELTEVRTLGRRGQAEAWSFRWRRPDPGAYRVTIAPGASEPLATDVSCR